MGPHFLIVNKILDHLFAFRQTTTAFVPEEIFPAPQEWNYLRLDHTCKRNQDPLNMRKLLALEFRKCSQENPAFTKTIQYLMCPS